MDIPPGLTRAAADDTSLVMWSNSGLVRMPLDPDQWATHLCRIIGRDLTDPECRIIPPGTHRTHLPSGLMGDGR